MQGLTRSCATLLQPLWPLTHLHREQVPGLLYPDLRLLVSLTPMIHLQCWADLPLVFTKLTGPSATAFVLLRRIRYKSQLIRKQCPVHYQPVLLFVPLPIAVLYRSRVIRVILFTGNLQLIMELPGIIFPILPINRLIRTLQLPRSSEQLCKVVFVLFCIPISLLSPFYRP